MIDYRTEAVTVYVQETQSIAASLRLAEAMLSHISNGGNYDAVEYLTNLATIRKGLSAAASLEMEVLEKLEARRPALT